MFGSKVIAILECGAQKGGFCIVVATGLDNKYECLICNKYTNIRQMFPLVAKHDYLQRKPGYLLNRYLENRGK